MTRFQDKVASEAVAFDVEAGGRRLAFVTLSLDTEDSAVLDDDRAQEADGLTPLLHPPNEFATGQVMVHSVARC